MGEGVHTIQTKTDRSYIRDTEKGLNRQEAFRVSQLESKIRNRKTEKGYLIGEDGSVIGESASGNSHRAKFYVRDLERARGGIMTHNHPNEGKSSGLFGTLAGRIGLPFSDTDIKRAIEYDLKEIRAVTPTYTYSMRRPKGGWGSQREVMGALDDYRSRFVANLNRYANQQARSAMSSYQRAKEVYDRANVGIQYSMMKDLAKRFGWEFTRRKV